MHRHRDRLFNGATIDNIARSPLNRIGLDFAAAVGHGIGHCLNVHENAVRVHKHAYKDLAPGNVIAAEPGYYFKDKEDERFGVRVEDNLIVRKDESENMWLENITFAPYERQLIDSEFLPDEHLQYVNEYHQNCLDKLLPLLEGDERTLDYLKRQCAPIEAKAK